MNGRSFARLVSIWAQCGIELKPHGHVPPAYHQTVRRTTAIITIAYSTRPQAIRAKRKRIAQPKTINRRALPEECICMYMAKKNYASDLCFWRGRLGRDGCTDSVSGRRHRIAEPLRNGATRGLETGPFVSVMEGRNRNELALVEPDQRRIDHVVRRHDDRRGQVLVGEAGDFPEVAGGRTRQHRLAADAFVGEPMLARS